MFFHGNDKESFSTDSNYCDKKRKKFRKITIFMFRCKLLNERGSKKFRFAGIAESSFKCWQGISFESIII